MNIKLFKENQHITKESGFILPVLLITGVMIVLMIVAVSTTTVTNQSISVKGNYQLNAQLAADAGLDDALNKINTVEDWCGTPGEVTLLEDTTQKLKMTYQVTVDDCTDPDDTQKTLTVTARTYSPHTASTPKTTRKYDLDIQAVTSGTGPTSVSTGVGGLILQNNAKISGGDVVVNGKITLGNNAQIGLSTNSVNVRAAHQSCPVPANITYPRVCLPAESGQPISIGNNGVIYADVRATNQTDGSRMYNPGLIPDQIVPPVILPSYDRAAQVAAVAVTYASTNSTVACGNNESKSWPANVKITGNITLGNNCTVTINGNAWVTGNVTMGNNAKFVVAGSLGTTVPTIMVDGGNTSGTGGFRFGNNAQIVPNASSTGVQVVSFWSNSTCSPDCASLTGTDLYNSQNIVTIDLSNNGSAPNTVLWSHWTKVRVSNNGAIGAVTGQTVELGNNAVINFTASVPGSDNLTTTWVKRGYMRVYN